MATTKRRNAKTKQNGRSDYVAFGSERHAQLLRLRKATKDDDQELVIDGYTFIDFTDYGPQASTRYLKAILGQRVRELNAKPNVPQSDNPHEPNYAPRMFDPDDLREGAVTQNEIDEAVLTLRRAGLV